MKAILAILVVGIVGYFVYAAVKPQKEPLKTGTKGVYYYPRANVYYDVATGQYIYFDGAEKTWKQSKKISEEQKLSLGEKAVIATPSSPIWKNNEQDKLVYSVNLYSSPNDLKQKFHTDSLSSVPPPPKVVVAPPKEVNPQQKTEEEKTKSGFKKFLDKIFKRKDKAKDS
jgi:hypothetical protein